MQVNGKIIEILDNNRAKVEIKRTSMCGENCASCGGCSMQTSVIIAECDDNIEINDEVFLEMSNSSFFKLSFYVFILPLLIIIISYQLMTFFNLFISDAITALLSFSMGITVFLGFIIYSRKLKMPKCYKV